MAFVLADRVKQTSTTSGTGTLSLISPSPGLVSFADGIGDGSSCAYMIDDGAGNWEITIGTVTAGSPDTLTRAATPLASSNSGARVSFSGATLTVAIVPLAELLVYFAAVPSYADDQILQRKSGAWVVRTLAQLAADLATGGNLDRIVQIQVTDPNGTALTTGDGKAYFRVNSELNGYKLHSVAGHVTTVSSSGAVNVQVNNVTQGWDMLSTALTIDANEKDSSTAATAAVIDTASSHDVISTADELRIDIDGAGTGAKGLIVELIFRKA